MNIWKKLYAKFISKENDVIELNSWWQLGKLGKLRHLHRDLRGWNPTEDAHVHKPRPPIRWCRLFWILHQFPDMQHKPLPKYVYLYCHFNLSFLPMSKKHECQRIDYYPHLINSFIKYYCLTLYWQYFSHITWLTICISPVYFVCIFHLYFVCKLHLYYFVSLLHLYFVCILHLYFVCISYGGQ